MDILIVKTFAVIVMMLCASALAARRNHAFETRYEFWGLFIAGLALVFIIPAAKMPINLILALVLAFIMGAIIGPGIKGMMMDYVVRKKLEKQGYSKKVLAAMTEAEQEAVMLPVINDIESPEHHSVTKDWNNILGLALYGTGVMTLITALVVAFSGFDFSILGMGLFIALLGLIVFSLLNYFFFKSAFWSLMSSYVGAVIFSLFLLYDFDRLEKAVASGDQSWETAINLGVSIYIDIINLFMDLLNILSSH